jgi:hypothetical protein
VQVDDRSEDPAVDEVVVRSRHRGSSRTGASSRVKMLPKNLIARQSRAGSQQHEKVPEVLLLPVRCARCRRWECERSSKQRDWGWGLLNMNTLVWIDELSRRRKGILYRRAGAGGGTLTSQLMRLGQPRPRPRRSERARVWHAFFIQLQKMCTERLLHKLDERLLKYPCGISHFSLALNKWVLILSLL